MFNENDVDFVVDVAIRELGAPNKVMARVEILKVLNVILDHEPYWQYYQHRLVELDQLCEGQIMFEDEDKPYLAQELMQLSTLNHKLVTKAAQLA